MECWRLLRFAISVRAWKQDTTDAAHFNNHDNNKQAH